MPKISVVIPTYNQAQYLGEALDSVFAQTYNDFEVIVVDDGSTDNTKKIVESFADSVCAVYQENKGRGAARQLGVNESSGEYIAFLDSDDKWFPKKLEKQMAYIKKNAFSGLLHTRIAIIDGNGMQLKEKDDSLNKIYKYAVKNGFSYASLLHKCPLFFSTVILPKKLILQSGGFREDYRVLEDFDFILRVAKLSKIDLLDEQLVWYRDHPGNASKVMKKEVEKTYLVIFNEELHGLNNIVNPKKRRIAEKYIYDQLINFSFELGDKHTSFIYLKELIKKQPLQILRIRELKNMLKLFGIRYPKIKK